MNRVSWGDLRDGRGFLVEMLLIWKETVLSLPRLFFWKQSCTWAVSLDHSVDIRNAGLIRISVILLILNLTVWNSNQAIVNLAPSNVCLVLQLPVSIFDQNLGSRPKWRVIAALHSKERRLKERKFCPVLTDTACAVNPIFPRWLVGFCPEPNQPHIFLLLRLIAFPWPVPH